MWSAGQLRVRTEGSGFAGGRLEGFLPEHDGPRGLVVIDERAGGHDDAVEPRRRRQRLLSFPSRSGAGRKGDVATGHRRAGSGEVKHGEGVAAVEDARECMHVMRSAGDGADGGERSDEGAGGRVTLQLRVEDAAVRMAISVIGDDLHRQPRRQIAGPPAQY